MGSTGKVQTSSSSITLSDSEIRQRLEDDGYEFTDNPEEAIYVLRNGDMVSGGFYDGIRGEDHRMIESVMDDIDRYDDNFWSEVFNRTSMLMLIPETKQALIGENQKLTSKQKYILKQLGYELERG